MFELEKKYNLNMSMFERLVKNEFGYTTLLRQRRMRPEISAIIRLLYPELIDDIMVTKYPNVRGVDKDVFFMDHQHFESSHDAMMSKLNDFEATMIHRFSQYLL